jgi:hypothetical protein
MDCRTFHITHQANDGQWIVCEEGRLDPLTRRETRGEAIIDGRELAATVELDGGVSQMIIHRIDGTIEEARVFGRALSATTH